MTDTILSGTLSISEDDVNGKSRTENLGTIDASALVADSDTKLAFATQVDNFARGINNLTTNTYKDSKVVVNFSINEILAS